jgi:hypothetical protein
LSPNEIDLASQTRHPHVIGIILDLVREIDSTGPYLDPEEPIPPARIDLTASRLRIPVQAARARYAAIAATFSLRLETPAALISSSLI